MNEPINGIYDDNGNKINPGLLPVPGFEKPLTGFQTLSGLKQPVQLTEHNTFLLDRKYDSELGLQFEIEENQKTFETNIL